MTLQERIAKRARDVSMGKLVLLVLSLPPYVAGFAWGYCDRILEWTWAAFAQGMVDGRGR